MKNILLKLLIISPVFLIIAVMNWAMDPAHLYSNGSYEREMAKSLLKGQDVHGVSSFNFDDRLLQKRYIENLSHKNDVVVIGASRAMEIGSELFPGARYFNNSVSRATLDDLMAIYEMYHRRGLAPSVMVLGLDPSMLNGKEPYNPVYRLAVENAYRELVLRAGLPYNRAKSQLLDIKALFEKYRNLLSPGYFQTSCINLIHRLKTAKALNSVPSSTAADDGNTKLSDGSIVWNKAVINASPAEVHSYAQRDIAGYRREDDKADPLGKKKFETFVSLAEKEGVRLVFYLAPFHPELYRHLQESGGAEFVDSMEAYFREVANQHHIVCLGSYDPWKCSLGATDFYDGVHAKRAAIAKLFKSEGPKLALLTKIPHRDGKPKPASYP